MFRAVLSVIMSPINQHRATSSFHIVKDYSAAINTLNTLQSNANYVKNISQQNRQPLNDVRKYIERSGLTLNDLDKLSVIHVTGTKGKGTTCALTESILRAHGLKTGFYSSPHLLEVRERIRINGIPIKQDQFARYFWKLYESLDTQKTDHIDMPLYFRFLTIMAFHVFLEEKVDVAIIEVGIGGQFDCTNILRKVPIVGITSLGMDHMTVLGDTLEDIAWNKSGIMKKHCQAFTVPQPENALKVLKNRSKERECSLKIVGNKNGSLLTTAQNLNSALAVSLAEAWIASCAKNGLKLSKDCIKLGLEKCFWPGRYQILIRENVRYFIDGAHTLESIKTCADWFKTETKSSTNKRVLLFNVTGAREPESMLRILHECHFDIVLFIPNIAGKVTNNSDTQYMVSSDALLDRCRENQELWRKISKETLNQNEILRVYSNIQEGIDSLDKNYQYELLTTGSIYLVGAVLSLFDPDLSGLLK